MAIASRRGTLALGALVAAIVVACGDDTPQPSPTPATTPVPHATSTAPSPTATTTASPPAAADRTGTATESPTPEATPTPSATPSPTPTATPEPIEYVPLTLGEPRPLPPGATLYLRQPDSCHGPVWWRRAVTTEAGELAWNNPFAKLPSIHADDWGPENWPPQFEGVSASGQTLVAEVCERGACQTFDRVDPDAARGVWGSLDAGETWERWGDYPDGGVWSVKEGDVAFRDADGRVKGFRSGEEWVPPERLPRPWVSSEVTDRLFNEEREPGELDLYVLREPGAILGAYSWGGEESYESHRPLWLIDHLEGHLFVGFLGSEACGDITRTVLVDFSSGTVHPIPGLEPGVDFLAYPILHKALLGDPPPPDSTSFRYDTYDTTGAVASAGSYTLLSDPDDTTTVVTTYEGLRDGSATAILIHTSDADGVSRADVYDAVGVGDLFEWHVADDCFVRYRITNVHAEPSGTTFTREFGVEWMTYAFTGCNGAIAAEVPATLSWGNLPDLGGAALLAPVIHGIYQIVPPGWRGETVDLVLDFSRPGQPPEYRSYSTLAEARLLPYWRDPALPEGWILEDARIGFEGPRNGYCATFITEERTWSDGRVYRNSGFDLCALSITGWYEPREAFDRNGVTETRVVAGRPAVVNYGRSSDDGYPIGIEVYDPETESEYEFRAHDSSIGGSNPEPGLAIVRGLFDGELSYDIDTTGAVSAAGSYSFMGEAEDGTPVPVTTYEGLRDGSTTSLVIHKTHANGASRTAILDSVRAGDLVEWYAADDCFVRYRITNVHAEPSGTTFTREFGVEWMTYAFTGCRGPIDGGTAAIFDWGELPDLGGASLTAPVIHGVHQLVPRSWAGPVKEPEDHWPDEYSDPVHLEGPSMDQLRSLDLWREPDLPEGWSALEASSGGVIDPSFGFTAWFSPPDGGIGLEFIGYFLAHRYSEVDAGLAEEGLVAETRVVAGRPALVVYSPPGENHNMSHSTTVHIVDPGTQTGYTLRVYADEILDAIALAESLFDEQAALAGE